jgi:hypothetical protein
MILLPGVQGARTERSSRLAFSWDARDRSLQARSGQQGVLSAGTGTALTLTPGYGSTITGGFGQPRFGRIGGSGGASILDLDASTSGAERHWLTFPFAVPVASLSVFLRLTPTWTMGASRGTANMAFGIGDPTIGARLFDIRRGGTFPTGWYTTRQEPTGGTNSGQTVEGAGLVAPLDVLATYDVTSRALTIQLRDATGTLTTAASGGTSLAAQTGHWSGDVLGLGNRPTQDALGLPIRLHLAKVAVGAVLTYADMDLLT